MPIATTSVSLQSSSNSVSSSVGSSNGERLVSEDDNGGLPCAADTGNDDVDPAEAVDMSAETATTRRIAAEVAAPEVDGWKEPAEAHQCCWPSHTFRWTDGNRCGGIGTYALSLGRNQQ